MLRLATSLITLLLLASPRIAASAESVYCFEQYCDLIPGYSHYPLQVKAGQPLFLRTPEPVRNVVAPQGATALALNHITSLDLVQLASGVFKVELGNGTVIDVELTPSKEAPSFAGYGVFFTKELARVEDAHRRAETERTNTTKAIAALSFSRSIVVPVDATYSQGDVSLLIESGWHWSSDEFVLSFALENTSKEPVEVGSIVTRDLSGKAVELIFEHLEISGPLQPGSATRGAVILPKEHAKQYDTLELTVSSATFSVTGMVPNWIPLQALQGIPLHELVLQEREKQELLKDARGRINLAVVGSIGGLWVPDDNAQTTDTAAAFLTAVNLRLTYGFHPNIAVDGEVGGASTGGAEFDEYKRSDTLGRLQFGGVLRIGSTAQVLLRAGLGVMVLSSSAEAIGGATAPDLGWSLAGYAYGSIGVERRFDWVVVGAGAGYAQASKSISAIEAGAHVGMSFKP